MPSPAREMFEAVEKQVNEDQFPIILAFDDVNVLFNDKSLSQEHSIYSRLISVLADIGQRIGTVVVSTALAVPLAAPSMCTVAPIPCLKTFV